MCHRAGAGALVSLVSAVAILSIVPGRITSAFHVLFPTNRVHAGAVRTAVRRQVYKKTVRILCAVECG